MINLNSENIRNMSYVLTMARLQDLDKEGVVRLLSDCMIDNKIAILKHKAIITILSMVLTILIVVITILCMIQ